MESHVESILRKYPDKLPILVRPKLPLKLHRHKFLVPYDLTFGQFLHVLRKHLKIESSDAVITFVNNKLMEPFRPMIDIYRLEKSPDKFLIIDCSLESAFG